MLIDKDSGELFLYGVIGQPDFFGDGEGLTDVDVIKGLSAIGADKRATVRINSPGGFVDDGIAIYNALKRHEPGVDVVVDSQAASIASVVALAGETRTTARGSRWMIHRAMGFGGGNVNEIRKLLSALEAGDRAILDIYGQHLNKDAGEVEAMMDAETWFTSEDAVEIGLATAIDGEATQQPELANWFRNAPEPYKQAAISGQKVLKAKYPVHRQAAAIRAKLA